MSPRNDARKKSLKPSPFKIAMHTPSEYQWCATRLKSLADPDRLRIVNCLLGGPKNVSELASELGEELVKVSHHLGVLRRSGVVQTEKRGKFIFYCLHPEINAAADAEGIRTLDLGCCRLDLPQPSE